MKKVSKNKIIFNDWVISQSKKAQRAVFYIVQNYARYALSVEYPKIVKTVSWKVEKC